MSSINPNQDPYSAASQDSELSKMNLGGPAPDFKQALNKGATSGPLGSSATSGAQSKVDESKDHKSTQSASTAAYDTMRQKFIKEVMISIAENICRQMENATKQMKKTYQQDQTG